LESQASKVFVSYPVELSTDSSNPNTPELDDDAVVDNVRSSDRYEGELGDQQNEAVAAVVFMLESAAAASADASEGAPVHVALAHSYTKREYLTSERSTQNPRFGMGKIPPPGHSAVAPEHAWLFPVIGSMANPFSARSHEGAATCEE